MEHSGVHHKCVTRFEYHIVGAQAYDHAPLEATDNAVLAVGVKQPVVLSGRVGESVGAEQQVRSLPNNAIAGRVRFDHVRPLCYFPLTVMAPSTTSDAPEIKEALGDARKRTASATSCGNPIRPSG